MRLSIILLALALVAIGILFIAFLKNGFPRKQNNFANNSSSPAGIISQLPQINSEGLVTVKVSPRDLSQSATNWDFEIVLDTHSQNLDQDLVNASILIDDEGNQFIPVMWEAASAGETEAPQEHHRQGILKFKPISPKPSFIELKILNIGDIDERIFKWELK